MALDRTINGFILLFLVSSCGLNSYSPTMQFIPEKSKKHDITIAGSTGSPATNGNLSYAISEEVGLNVLGSYDFDLQRDDGGFDRNIFELSGYSFNNVKSKKLHWGIIGGVGFGNYHTKNYEIKDIYQVDKTYHEYINSTIKYHHCYIAPFIFLSTPSKRATIAFALRVSYVNFSTYIVNYRSVNKDDLSVKYYYYNLRKPYQFVIEPTVKGTIGKGRLKFLNELTIPIAMHDFINTNSESRRIEDVTPFSFQIGFTFQFTLKKNSLQ